MGILYTVEVDDNNQTIGRLSRFSIFPRRSARSFRFFCGYEYCANSILSGIRVERAFFCAVIPSPSQSVALIVVFLFLFPVLHRVVSLCSRTYRSSRIIRGRHRRPTISAPLVDREGELLLLNLLRTQPTIAPARMVSSSIARQRIVVPQRPIQGGFDMKFETDPYEIDLKGLMTSEQYTDALTAINDGLRPSRSGVIDKALLFTGPLIVPLALWGVRHSNQNRRRKRLLRKAVDEFNTKNPALLMRWNRQPQSCLTIERRHMDEGQQPMAEAQLVPGVVYGEEVIGSHGDSNRTPRAEVANNTLV